MERRRKRNKEKADKKRAKEGAAAASEPTADSALDQVTWLDRIEAYTNVRPVAGKLRAFRLLHRVLDLRFQQVRPQRPLRSLHKRT